MIKNFRKKMKDVAYSSIKDRIMSGELPPGTSISEESLAKELGISRTPIREAMVMLEAEELIKVYPNKGPNGDWIKFTGCNLDITNKREGLEGVAARIACDMEDKEELISLKEKMLKLDNLKDETQIELSYKYGRKIDDILIKSTGNEKMIKILENMTLQLDRFMKLSRLAPQRAEIAFDQHLSIIDAVIEGDQDEAERRVRNHIRSVSNDVIKVFQQDYI